MEPYRPMDEERWAPSVSVIVPARDEAGRIGRCIEALRGQTYPSELLEIIIVDNGSTDGTRELASQYPVRVLAETSRATPYVARNCGIAVARGEVIALTDADCVPEPDWVERGVQALRTGADLVGGRVAFSFAEGRTWGESYDAISNLEMKNNIENRGVAKTGNLFFRRDVVDRIGPFPSDVRSGGDVIWTGTATRAGLSLVYADDVVVTKDARGFRALMKKQFRVGRGQLRIWVESGEGSVQIAKRILFGFTPFSLRWIRENIRARGTPEMEAEIVGIWCVAWVSRVVTNLGRIRSILAGVR
jgi:glycosyltransferase AglE